MDTNLGGNAILNRARDFAFPLAAPLLVLMALAYWPFKVDDAYTSFVYGKNLVEGHGLTYNGIVVEGYSNFLWTVMIAPFIAVHWDPLLVARGFSLVLACACIWLVNQIMRQMAPASHWPIRLLPLLTLARVFELGHQRGSSFHVLVLGEETNAVGLAVDRILGQREIVVRAIKDPLAQSKGIAGATELGDQRVVLILDIAALRQLAVTSPH